MWIKIDDRFNEHPKFAKAGPLSIAMWLAGLAYCNRNLTDGFIPWATARSMLTWQYLDPEYDDDGAKIWTVGVTCGHEGDNVTCERVIDLLVNAELWEEVNGGYRVHNYEKYQMTEQQVKAERERWKDRQNKHRNAVSHAVSHGVTHTESHGGVTPVPLPVTRYPSPEIQEPTDLLNELPLSGANGNGHRNGKLRVLPYQRPPLPDGEITAERAFDQIFWPRYPRHVGKLAAFRAWRSLKLRDDDQAALDAIMAGLDRDVKTEWAGREADKIPHPATWLNQRRWEDER